MLPDAPVMAKKHDLEDEDPMIPLFYQNGDKKNNADTSIEIEECKIEPRRFTILWNPTHKKMFRHKNNRDKQKADMKNLTRSNDSSQKVQNS